MAILFHNPDIMIQFHHDKNITDDRTSGAQKNNSLLPTCSYNRARNMWELLPAGRNQNQAKATILLETSLESAAGMILASVTSTEPQGAREDDVQRFCFPGPHNSCTQPGLWDLCWPLRSSRQSSLSLMKGCEKAFFYKKQRNPLRC